MPKKIRLVVENFVFQHIEELNSLEQIHNIKKLKGHNDTYRIRFGDYRLGLIYKDEQIFFERIAHRSEFYRKFPG